MVVFREILSSSQPTLQLQFVTRVLVGRQVGENGLVMVRHQSAVVESGPWLYMSHVNDHCLAVVLCPAHLHWRKVVHGVFWFHPCIVNPSGCHWWWRGSFWLHMKFRPKPLHCLLSSCLAVAHNHPQNVLFDACTHPSLLCKQNLDSSENRIRLHWWWRHVTCCLVQAIGLVHGELSELV